MDKKFIGVLQKIVQEQGKEVFLDEKKCKSHLADYARGEYKKECKFLIRVLEEGVANAIYNADDLNLCKKKQIKRLVEENFSEDAANDFVNMLAWVLRGDITITALQSETIEKSIKLPSVQSIQKDTYDLPKISGIKSNSGNAIIKNSIIDFGKYKWIVLNVDNDKAMIISREIVHKMKFADNNNNWDKSIIRKYLNDTFFNGSFNDNEKERILVHEKTDDKIFLLSCSDAEKYMSEIKEYGDIASWWWLRSPGVSNDSVSCVSSSGYISTKGNKISSDGGGVRPVLVLSLSENKTNVNNMQSINNVAVPTKPTTIHTTSGINCNSQGLVSTSNVQNVKKNVSMDSSSIIIKPKEKSIIKFGAYDWFVLNVQNDRALIITKDIIEQRSYSIRWYYDFLTWEICNLRSYLNDDFFASSSFSNADRNRIITINNRNEDNQWYKSNGCKDTSDRIFLLSILEVVKYFGDSGQLFNKNRIQQNQINDHYNSVRVAKFNNLDNWWWLRSPGRTSSEVSCIINSGFIYIAGCNADNIAGGVRPALWLKL